MVKAILLQYIPVNEMVDKVVWALSPNGCYFVRTRVDLLQQGIGLHPLRLEGFKWI